MELSHPAVILHEGNSNWIKSNVLQFFTLSSHCFLTVSYFHQYSYLATTEAGHSRTLYGKSPLDKVTTWQSIEGPKYADCSLNKGLFWVLRWIFHIISHWDGTFCTGANSGGGTEAEMRNAMRSSALIFQYEEQHVTSQSNVSNINI